MAIVHVAGPVIRDRLRGGGWVRDAYSAIAQAARDIGSDTTLPYSEPELERAEPAAFFEVVRGRVGRCDIVVTVFTGADVSAGVEAGMAAMLGKKQLIITDDPRRLPRLLKGLPGANVLHETDGQRIFDEVRSFLKDNLESPRYMS